jgi:hypothetical protein
VESTILISGQVLILYRYIKGRNEVKQIIATEKTDSVAEIEETTGSVTEKTKKTTKTKKPQTKKKPATKKKTK